MMTYERLIELAREGDPIIDLDDRYSVGEEGLVIAGRTGEVIETSEIRMVIETAGVRVWVRDPEGIEDPFHGPTWTHETYFEQGHESDAELVDRIRDWVYAW